MNHAKKIVMDEAEEYAKQLQNGKAGDPHTQGRAIALIVKMICPMYAADFVTMEECKRQHDSMAVAALTAKEIIEEYKRQIEPQPSAIVGKRIELKAGPFEFKGNFSPQVFLAFLTIASVFGLVLVVGKVQGWW